MSTWKLSKTLSESKNYKRNEKWQSACLAHTRLEAPLLTQQHKPTNEQNCRNQLIFKYANTWNAILAHYFFLCFSVFLSKKLFMVKLKWAVTVKATTLKQYNESQLPQFSRWRQSVHHKHVGTFIHLFVFETGFLCAALKTVLELAL